MRRIAVVLLFSALAFSVFPTLSPSSQALPPTWTLLVYLDADNNLEPYGIDDFVEMAAVGTTPAVQVIVLMDRAPGYDSRAGGWTGARMFNVIQGLPPESSNVFGGDLGEVNMADPQTLVNFVTWGITQYPADHYLLDLWDHGQGWNGVIVDETSAGDILAPQELASALADIATLTGERIDILANDACRMTFEIMYELRSYVDIFIGSEKDTPIEGWDYELLLTRWNAGGGLSPTEVAALLPDVYYDGYVGQTVYAVALSAVNAWALGGVAENLTLFADELISYIPYFASEIQDARARTERYEFGGVCCGDDFDLYHFTETVQEEVGSPRLTRIAGALRSAIEDAVLYERHWDNPNPTNGVRATHAHGLSLFFPSGFPPSQYRALLSSVDTSWDEFLIAYGGGPAVVLGMTAAAQGEDPDGNGIDDRINVTATPSVDGAVAVEVTGEHWDSTRVVPAVAGERVLLYSVPPVPGWYGVAVYLFESGLLRNMTVLLPVAIEERRCLSGSVSAGGLPVTGSLTVRNPRTGAEATAAITDGRFNVSLVYPTWASDGEPVELRVTATGQVTRFTIIPSWDCPASGVSLSLQAGSVIDPVSLVVGLVAGLVIALALIALLAFLRRRKRDRLLE